MKIIGLIGEDPYDTTAISNLLTQKFKDLLFKPILKNKRGYQLDTSATVSALEVELDKHQYHTIIFIRDLDGLSSEEKKIKQKNEWFERLNIVSKKKGIFLLNIYEIEALIISDIDIFNKEYKTNLRNIGNVMFKTDPKGFLKSLTFKSKKRYSESHCPELFKKLRYDIVKKNCKYFADFNNNFEKKIKKAS